MAKYKINYESGESIIVNALSKEDVALNLAEDYFDSIEEVN